MKIYFKSKSIRKICEDHKKARKKLGLARTKLLHSRIADIRAANSVSELTAGHPHPLRGDRRCQFAVNLDKKTRLVFCEFGQSNSDSLTDWDEVSEIQIIEIVDYHD